MDPISTARYGMMTATAQLTGAASRIASAGGDALGDVDYAAEAVNMVEAQQSFKANVDVIKVADSMWQSLLNLQAVAP
jgi:flagellar hook protein FlgE